MHELDVSSVTNWVPAEGWWMPQSIDSLCPHCGRAVNFSLLQPSFDAQRKTIAATAVCPGCRGAVHVWTVEPSPATDQRGTSKGLLMFPPPRQQRGPVPGTELIPQRISTVYAQALSVYNAGLWNVAVGCCRQTLDAVARAMLPPYEIQENLAQNIKRLSSSAELKNPILDISHAIREGGKLAAVLDLKREPDQETARLVLDLTEYLLQFLFTLPKLTEQAKNRVDGTMRERRGLALAG